MLLLVRFTHVFEQFVVPEVHAQALLTQLEPEICELQLLPHVPQFAVVFVRLVHVPEHRPYPAANVPPLHALPQLPALQNSSLLTLQAVPQPPQLLLSVWVLTQTPLHRVEPVGHWATQLPALHAGVAPEHAWPQLPQLLASTCVFTQTPLQLSVVDVDAQHCAVAPASVESLFDTSPAEHVDVKVYEISS